MEASDVEHERKLSDLTSATVTHRAKLRAVSDYTTGLYHRTWVDWETEHLSFFNIILLCYPKIFYGIL